MHPVPCISAHYDVIDLVNHGIVKNMKTWNLESGPLLFDEKKNS